MTTAEDDPRLLQSWEDAFNYPIPIVRGMERRLRANVEEGRERLRGVVGYEYHSSTERPCFLTQHWHKQEQLQRSSGYCEDYCRYRCTDARG